MATPVTLVGLDFGTTTSSAVVAAAELVTGAIGGRVELTGFRDRFRSELTFTPIDDDDRLDLSRIETQLDEWLSAAGVETADVFGGGVLLTGLTAEKENARGLVELVRRRLGNMLVAAASDPHLESWLAFMGSCGELSRLHRDIAILNFDIGGGTTNPALGRAGQVSATACTHVGARHFQFEPGGYRLVKISRHGVALLADLGICKQVGDELTANERRKIVDRYVRTLEDIIAGKPFAGPSPEISEQISRELVENRADPAVTFSGGVGELIYQHFAGDPWPPTTTYGDLGVDLAQGIVASSLADPHRCRLRPASTGRATAYGLLRHTTEVSGSTLFLPDPDLLPLPDVPILGRVESSSSDAAIRSLLELAKCGPGGGALQVSLDDGSAASVAGFGTRLAGILQAMSFPPQHPLVLLIRENLGKTLGQYATAWGTLPISLLVVDEVAPRDAQFLHIGLPRSRVVPVSFYGLRPSEPPHENAHASRLDSRP